MVLNTANLNNQSKKLEYTKEDNPPPIKQDIAELKLTKKYNNFGLFNPKEDKILLIIKFDKIDSILNPIISTFIPNIINSKFVAPIR